MHKLIRITTVPISLDKLLSGQLAYMNQFFDVIGVSSDKNYLDMIAVKEKIKVHEVNMTRTISPIQDLKSIWSLYKFLRRERPTIVHTHTPKAGMVGMIASWLARVPVRLHTVAGLPLMETQGLKRLVLDKVEWMTYLFAHKVFPNSNELLKFIQKNKYTSNTKLKVIGSGSTNGINTSHFSVNNFTKEDKVSLRNKLHIDNEDFVFIFVGRLVKDKGINELIESFTELLKEHSNIKLLLVGPFEEELSPLENSTIEVIKSNKKIISVGYQNDVRPYFAISHVLVFPSYREGFPNVVMQAGSMGLPCIVSDINGCNEIIVNGYNGIIIPAKNKALLQKAMKEMITNVQSYTSMKSKSRDMITKRYEQSIVWEAILEEYKLLLAEKGIKFA